MENKPASAPWKLIAETPAYDGYRKVARRAFAMPDGSEKSFDIKMEGASACTLALTDRGTVVLSRQFRPGPLKTVDELPGGFMDAHEVAAHGGDETAAAMAAAERELREETGFRPGRLLPAGPAITRCAYSTGRIYAFLALGCSRDADQRLDEGEHVEPVEIPLNEFRRKVRDVGDLSDMAVAYRCLDLYDSLPKN